MIKDKRRAVGLFAVALSLCMILVSVVSPVLFEKEEVREAEDMTLAGKFWDDWRNENGSLNWKNIGIDLVKFVCPPIFISTAMYDGLKGNGGGGGGSGGDPSEIAKQLRAYESELVYIVLQMNSELLTNSVNGYADIWKLTNNFWMRQAEVAAAERWASNVDYYAPYILERCGLIDSLAQLFENIEDGSDSSFSFINDRLTAWASSSQQNQMKIYLQYGSNTLTDSSNFDIKMRNAITVSSSSANTAYLDGRELWVFGGNAKIYSEKGNEYQLASGFNDLSAMGINSGTYAFQPDRSYSGSIVPILSSKAAQVYASAVVQTGESLKLVKYSNSLVYVDNTSYDSLSLYIDTGDSSVTEKVNIMQILEMHDMLLSSTYTSLTKAHVSAQAAWMVFDKAQESNILISPSALIPNLENIDVSSEEMYTLTVLYLEQIYDFWQRSNGNLKDTGFNLSADSLDLYLRGNIYDENGNMLYSSVVFTPYIWLNSVTLTEGKNTFNQSGMIAVWGTSQNPTGWQGTSGYIPTMLSFKSGYSVEIAQIMHDETLKSSVTLKVLEIEPWHDIQIDHNQGGLDIHVADLVPFVAAILFLVGLNLLQFGAYNKHDLIIIVGVICFILALVGAEWIAGFL